MQRPEGSVERFGRVSGKAETADSRGRITLGKEFANKTFLFEKIRVTEMKLEVAAVIPEKELWLFKNREAKALLEVGLEQAKLGKSSTSPPDLGADQALVDKLED